MESQRVSPFRRVEAQNAGPRALGILVPPGARTLVILRPRSLSWDLLPAHWDGEPSSSPRFCLFERDEAAVLAREVQRALEQAVATGINPVQTVGDPQGQHFQVWLRTPGHVWLLCERAQGQAYRPAVFATQEAAIQEAERLTPIVWPSADAAQEFYFNTQQFVR